MTSMALTGPAGLEVKPKEELKCPFLASQVSPDQKDKEVEGMRMFYIHPT